MNNDVLNFAKHDQIVGWTSLLIEQQYINKKRIELCILEYSLTA